MITVYSKPNCMQCLFTKNWLTNNNIDYEEINVEDSQTYIDLLKHYGFSALPVVAIDNNLDNAWHGFNVDRLNELVKSYGEII